MADAKNMMNAIDGRQAYVWYLKPAAEAVATALHAGDVIIVKSQAESGSKFGSANLVNRPYIVAKDIATLTSGDTYIKCEAHFIGMATDKSVNKSKSTSEITCDFDAAKAYTSDGVVDLSGSINLMYSVDGKGYASTFIKQRFGSVDIYNADGTVEVLESSTTEKDLLLFAWNARDAKEDDLVEFEVIPALITSLDHSSSYGSPQSMNVNFSGNASDENGYEARVMVVPGGKAVIKKLATTRAEAENLSKS